MRTYTSYLLLEDLFDYLPNTSQLLTQFTDNLFNPTVEVSEIDCGTTLGKVVDLTFGAIGYIELATNTPITSSRVNGLLQQGVYKVALRNLHSCTAIGGICQECYRGSFPYKTLPAINELTKIPQEYTFAEDVHVADGLLLPSYSLSIPVGSYSGVLVYAGDSFIPNTSYAISNNILTFGYVPPVGTSIVIKYITTSAKPLLNYLANTYAGSLLGMKALPTSTIVLRESLLKSMISSNQLDNISRELENYKAIPEAQQRYTDSISDPLERALYMIALFGIYSNVSVQ